MRIGKKGFTLVEVIVSLAIMTIVAGSIGAFIIAGFSISLTICMIWPNCQLLRPVVVDTSNLCGWLVNAIYTADTPTNVLPSMHVVGCMGVLAAVCDSQYLK